MKLLFLVSKMLAREQSPDKIIKRTSNFGELNFVACKKSAEKGNPYGVFMLGYCYEHGIDVEKDVNKAFNYYLKSADMNNSNGLFQVGFCYQLGIGIEMDEHKAFEYYRKSAELNNYNGIFKTAICYLYGIGVEKNETKYREWIRKDPIRYHSIRRNSFPRGRSSVIREYYSRDYYQSRNPSYGKCAHCNKDNTFKAWCLTCDPDIAVQGWTSRNEDIDKCIKEFQFRAFKYKDVIDWIPFNRLSDIKEIGKGGFGSVYSATWLDGIRKVGGSIYNYVKAREPSSVVALKTLASSKENNFDFLKEFRSLMECKINYSKLAIYGITQNTETNEYMMVFQYANDGSLYKYLNENFSKLTWMDKLQILKDISWELYRIHVDAGYIHADFHSGNILQDQQQSYIADLGLSRKKDESISEGDIYGVMPYVAPEVLSGQHQFTQAADIYGFGVIMAEVSTGQRPFDGYEFDTELATKIYNGLRPEFAFGTPDCYIELANQCMNSDPQERPSALHIYGEIQDWLAKLTSDEENTIKKQFLNADKIIRTLQLIPQLHSDHMYTSKIISTQKISNAVKELSTTSKYIEFADIPTEY